MRVLDRAAGLGGMIGARGGTCGLLAGRVVLLLLWEVGPEVKNESLDGSVSTMTTCWLSSLSRAQAVVALLLSLSSLPGQEKASGATPLAPSACNEVSW